MKFIERGGFYGSNVAKNIIVAAQQRVLCPNRRRFTRDSVTVALKKCFSLSAHLRAARFHFSSKQLQCLANVFFHHAVRDTHFCCYFGITQVLATM